MRDVARLAGVSVATASRTLNDHPDVSAAARVAVRRAMERLAYRPDPVLRALGRYRWPAGRRSAVPAIAYLVDRWTGSGPGKWAALRRRAEGLGYRVESIHLRADSDVGALARRLIDRGVGGVVVDLHGDAIALDLPWDRIAGVVVGEGLPDLALPRVSTDWPRVVADAAARLRARGRQRLGMIVRDYIGRGLREELLGAGRAVLGAAGDVADAVILVDTEVLRSDGQVAAWYMRHRPDGVIGDTPEQARQLRAAGASLPDACSFVTLLNGGARKERLSMAGYRLDLEQRIERAVDLLHARLLHAEPQVVGERLLLMASWVDGRSFSAE